MAITLRPITEDNFIDAFNLKLKDGQERFVSHPIRSLAQAYVYRDQCQPFGIYSGGLMVGYVMVIYDRDVPEYDIWHMMIDGSQQGNGFGKAALELVLEYIKGKPFGDSGRVALTCNTVALGEGLRGQHHVGQGLDGRRPEQVDHDDEVELALTV